MSSNKASNKATVSHIALAYIGLIAVILLAWSLVVSPLMDSLLSQRAATSDLRTKLNEQRSDSSISNAKAVEITKKLETLISSGELSTKNSTANLSHEAQESIKVALQEAGARLDQLRPSQLDSSKWLHHTKLDVSFQIDPNKLGDLLASLNQSTPRSSINLLSLRAATNWGYEASDRKRGPQFLEANLQLSSVAASDALMTLISKPIEPSSEPTEPQPPATRSQAANTPTESLGGLFNKDTRARQKAPGPQHYRLSAITRSSQAAVAILIDKQSGETHRLKEGSKLEGWMIEQITESTVDFVLEDRKLKLTLD